MTGSILLVHPLLTLAYVVTGKLALMLAVPPGYASPIFPPAGIAVAAMLIAGRVTLPWTFLGSFLLNLWIGYSLGHRLDEHGFAAAIVIAAASTLQAAGGGSALRHAIGYPAPLDNSRDLSRFLLLAPVICLISASLSLSGLSALGVVKPADLAESWVSWWIGDTLGVLVVVPLTLVLAGEPRELWRSRLRPVALPILLSFVLFTAIFIRVSSWEHDGTLLEFRILSQQMVDKIRTGLEQQDVFLEQLERSFSGRAALSQSDFAHHVESLLQRFPVLQAVEWAPRIDATRRARFEAAQQPDSPGFAIRELGPSGELRRAGERALFYPVTYVEPSHGNEQAVGFDLTSDSDRKAAVEQAINTGSVAATAPIRLVQEQGEEAGILLIFAVHDGSNGAGVVLVVLRMGTFTESILAPVNAMISVRLVDLERDKALYGGFSLAPGAVSYQDVFAFGGRRYSVQTIPTALYLAQHRGWQSWAVLVAGVFSTGILGALLLLGTGYTRQVEKMVEERTRDLESVNQQLQLEIKERQQAEAALRQAQRLEAIGQLTGGIAHDFNNLLMVVSGNAGLLNENARDDAVRRRASAIMQAAERGQRLTRQLLAFSRRRTLRPEPVDLRQRLHEIVEMLSRSLPEDIEVTVEMPEDIWPVVIDRAEFELALLNIGVNARDAMPRGGQFRIEARNAALYAGDMASNGLSGEFVAVTLSDTGSGMTEEVLERAFEPFFTTKEVGVGSGLGLSQVYGFAKQSGGTAVLASAVDVGTSITLFLPRATKTSVALHSGEADAVLSATRVRILLVEDDREVAAVTAELLQEIGCQAVSVYDGRAALAMLERDVKIDLVMSDIVMPGDISGIELARMLRDRRPDLPVLLTTGYSKYARQVVDEGFELIEKPYARDMLAASIQRAAARRQHAPHTALPSNTEGTLET
jgi:signal transduction histidine kinase/CheY-like chemotaxis protein